MGWMKFCDEHKAGIRLAIRARGMAAYVAKGAEEGEGAWQRTFTLSPEPDTPFDPLLDLYMKIAIQVVKTKGMKRLLRSKCPFCDGALTEDWMQKELNETAKLFRRHGWISGEVVQ